MAECNSPSSVSQEVIEEEPTADELTENASGEESHVQEVLVNADNMATNKKELSEDLCKVRKMRNCKKGKAVKLVPKEHACQPARLPIPEVILYVVGWTAAALYSLYAVLELSMAKGDRLHKESMGPGWNILERKKDVSNFEWTFWSNWFLRMWPWFFAHIIVAQLLRKWNNKHRKYIFLAYHSAALFAILGVQAALFVLCNCVVIFAAAWCGSVILVWTVSIALIAFLNYDPYTAHGDFGFHPLKQMTDYNEDVFYLLVFSIAMTNLRYTSFALDWITAQKRAKQDAIEQSKQTSDIPKSKTTADVANTDNENHGGPMADIVPVINEPESGSEKGTDERGTSKAESRFEEDTSSVASKSEKESSASGSSVDGNKKLQECEQDDSGSAKNNALVDNCESAVKTNRSEMEVKYSLIDMLSYCLYLPYYFTGPITTYDEFYKQFNTPMKEWSKQDWRDILTSTLRVIFWAIFIEVVLHYFYFNSIMLHLRLMWHIPLWALAGIGYGAGQFFMVKYVVLFGLPGTVGKLDQLQPPQPPRCIAYIYKYSEMWKYFDRGLYSFLKRHIYVPLGGSRKGIGRQLVASAVCFSFIFWWHGGEWNLFYWSLVNFVGICLETGGRLFADIPRVVQWEALWLSPGMGRRIRALLGIPLLMMSSAAIFTFFGGNQVGYIFLYRLLYEGAPTSVLIICAAFYCFCQTSMEMERWRRRKAERSADSKQKVKVQ